MIAAAARRVPAACALVLLAAACSPPGLPAPSATSTPPATPTPESGASIAGWRTDFSRLDDGVSLDEFIRALPARDLIPPLDEPSVVPVGAVDFLADAEPVIAVEVAGTWRAYPIQILIWHEVANDRLGGSDITVTFCPLCYTSVVFSRVLDGVVYDFGVSGYLRFSDQVMYDRQTETWWQQATGRALAGELVGQTLTILPSQVVSWAAFRDAHPEATVLSRDTGHSRPYGTNPYPGWDNTQRNPFLGGEQLEPCQGEVGCIDPKERVGVLMEGGQTVIFRFVLVAEAGGLVHDAVGGTPVVVRWLPDVTSALGQQLLERSDQVGTLVAFDRRVAGRALTFVVRDGELQDRETGSTWDRLGTATGGPLAGERLRPLVMDTPYWFAAAAFATNVRIWAP